MGMYISTPAVLGGVGEVLRCLSRSELPRSSRQTIQPGPALLRPKVHQWTHTHQETETLRLLWTTTDHLSVCHWPLSGIGDSHSSGNAVSADDQSTHCEQAPNRADENSSSDLSRRIGLVAGPEFQRPLSAICTSSESHTKCTIANVRQAAEHLISSPIISLSAVCFGENSTGEGFQPKIAAPRSYEAIAVSCARPRSARTCTCLARRCSPRSEGSAAIQS